MKNFFNQLDPLELRNIINERIMDIDTSMFPVHSVLDQTIVREERSTQVRMYIPSNASNLPMILMIHGGAWVAGNLDTHDNMARYLCAKGNAIVVSVGYKNSPESKFPYPLEQCYDVLLWMAKNTRGDASRIAILGDSNGANMASALCLMAKDRKESNFEILLQVLINPIPDLTMSDMPEMMTWYISQYAEAHNRSHPYASPALSNNLENLPKTLILLGEEDAFYETGKKYAEQLCDHHVFVNVYTQQEVGHLAGDVARATPQAQESLDVALAALCGVFWRRFS